MDDSRLESNKALVKAFYELAFNHKCPAEAAAKYLDVQYRQHNPEVADGAAGFVEFASGFTRRFPQLQIDIKRALADGEFVVLHIHARVTPQDRGAVVIDIFRVQQQRIVEHWDAIQPVAEHPLHRNGPF